MPWHWEPTKDVISCDKLSDEVVEKGYWSSYYGYKEFTLDNIPSGKVYIAFDGKSVYVDNIYGFQKTAVDHDVFFTSTSMKDVGTVNTNQSPNANSDFFFTNIL